MTTDDLPLPHHRLGSVRLRPHPKHGEAALEILFYDELGKVRTCTSIALDKDQLRALAAAAFRVAANFLVPVFDIEIPR